MFVVGRRNLQLLPLSLEDWRLSGQDVTPQQPLRRPERTVALGQNRDSLLACWSTHLPAVAGSRWGRLQRFGRA